MGKLLHSKCPELNGCSEQLTRTSLGGGVLGASLLVWGLFTLLTGGNFWMAVILPLVGFIFVVWGFAPKKEKEAPREQK
jgi:hypothetical protein